MNLQDTDPDDAALRYWLRPRPGMAHHRKPAWLDHNIDAATTGILLNSLLGQWVAAGHLRRHHAYVWTAQTGLLGGAPLRQKELAATFGVSDRTIRAWVTHADSVITRKLKNLDLQAFLSATPVGSEPSAHARGVVSIAALLKSLIVEDAPTEHLEAVRTYAADHLGDSHHRAGPGPNAGSGRGFPRPSVCAPPLPPALCSPISPSNPGCHRHCLPCLIGSPTNRSQPSAN